MSEVDTGLEELLETGLHCAVEPRWVGRPRPSSPAFDRRDRHPKQARIAWVV